MTKKRLSLVALIAISVSAMLGTFPSLAAGTTSSQLIGMAAAQLFDGSEASKTNYATSWSTLGWAAEKGNGVGWKPTASYPTVAGAFNTATITDTGAGIAAVATLYEEPAFKDWYFSLWLDASGSSGARTGYELRFTEEGTLGPFYKVSLSKWQAGTQTVLASQPTYKFPEGSSLAILDQGGTVSGWTKTGSEFTQLISAGDSTFSSGNAGLEGSGNITRLKPFKVGALLDPVQDTDEAIKSLASLDSFGTNENPLSGGGKWSSLSWANGGSGHDSGWVSSGWGPYDSYPAINGAYWNTASFTDINTGTGVAATLSAHPENTSRYFSLWINMPKPASARSGYELRFTETAAGVYEVLLLKWEAGTKATLASKSNYSLSTNRRFALIERAGKVSAWADPTGEEYIPLLSASDNTFSSGYSGLEGSGNITRLKHFQSGQLPTLLPPKNATLPVPSPDPPLQAVTVTTTNGTWTGESSSFSYQWRRCNASGKSCSDISEAKSSTYKPVGNDVGSTLLVGVTAKNDGGATMASSKPTSVVEPIGQIVEYSVPENGEPYGEPDEITAGPDGNMWITRHHDILRLTTSGKATELLLPVEGYGADITTGPDGNVWYTAEDGYFENDYIISISPATLEQTIYKLPSEAGASSLTSGPDGNLWYGSWLDQKIGKVTTSGAVTEYSTQKGSYLTGIVTGPDGKLWFTNRGLGKVGSITTSGTITEYSLPAGSSPSGITAGPDGNLWFTNFGTDRIGRVTTAGSITEFNLPAGSDPSEITVGAEGGLWFTEYGTDKIGRISTEGSVSEYALPAGSEPSAIASGPDKRIWFINRGTEKVGSIVP